jgi:hypothetical protein
LKHQFFAAQAVLPDMKAANRGVSRNIGQVNVLKMRGEPLAGQLPGQTDAGLVVL